jgi:hypothetical protein
MSLLSTPSFKKCGWAVTGSPSGPVMYEEPDITMLSSVLKEDFLNYKINNGILKATFKFMGDFRCIYLNMQKFHKTAEIIIKKCRLGEFPDVEKVYGQKEIKTLLQEMRSEFKSKNETKSKEQIFDDLKASEHFAIFREWRELRDAIGLDKSLETLPNMEKLKYLETKLMKEFDDDVTRFKN